ncbi:nucleotidyltransferase domain-containing protein [Nocardioides sp.]|uniref:nucleotidyltransferase domain-containing protein n=1 Tax=Nocardioides sp. TaxID=35761 RepID=UPI0031FEFF59|nr:hypothetical protein [Nocardioides sp.]
MNLTPESTAALEEIVDRDDPGILGLVLSGSAAREMATEHSDVDVYVVLTDDAARGRLSQKSPAIDEIPVTLAWLESPGVLGSDEWWCRWSFAWARILRDHTGGRLEAALARQATLVGAEREDVLTDRLDGYVNFVFRALKADRDGRSLERRLDSAESVPWLLDTVFALAGRVRPYNKYLPWELREHPLGAAAWAPDRLLPLLERMLDGDPSALRAGFAAVESACRDDDADEGRTRLGDLIDSWGNQILLLRE